MNKKHGMHLLNGFLLGTIVGAVFVSDTHNAFAQTTDPGIVSCPVIENTAELPYYYSAQTVTVLMKDRVTGNACIKCETVASVAMPQVTYKLTTSRTRDQSTNFSIEIAGLFKFIVGSKDANTFKNESGFKNGTKIDYEETHQYPAPGTPPDLWPKVGCDMVGQYYQRESRMTEWEKRWEGNSQPAKPPRRDQTMYNLAAINFVTWSPKVEKFNFCTQQKEPLPPKIVCSDGSEPVVYPNGTMTCPAEEVCVETQ